MAKILIANKFYYQKGGDCTATLSLEQLLKQKGHDTAVFAMRHPLNLSTPWSRFFPSEVKFSLGMGLFKTLMRPFGTNEVKKKFTALLDEFKPDIVHMNNIHSQLSPIIVELSHQRKIKVVWTLHDYKLLCPRYDCLRNGETICEICFKDKRNVLKYKCMKGSALASYIAYKEAKCWNRERLEASTDSFICPSQFMANKMIEGGYNKNRIHTLCNFIDVDKCQKESYKKEDYYCFVGRISGEKGIKTLIEAANQLPYKLIIVGKGPTEEDMRKLARPNIEFAGFRQWDEIKEIVGNAKFSILPSECYENNPFSIIEAQCLGTPVLGARIGGIPELIIEGKNGFLFKPQNGNDLKEKITMMFGHTFDYEALAKEAQIKYSSDKYYTKLMDIYSDKN